MNAMNIVWFGNCFVLFSKTDLASYSLIQRAFTLSQIYLSKAFLSIFFHGLEVGSSTIKLTVVSLVAQSFLYSILFYHCLNPHHLFRIWISGDSLCQTLVFISLSLFLSLSKL